MKTTFETFKAATKPANLYAFFGKTQIELYFIALAFIGFVNRAVFEDFERNKVSIVLGIWFAIAAPMVLHALFHKDGLLKNNDDLRFKVETSLIIAAIFFFSLWAYCGAIN